MGFMDIIFGSDEKRIEKLKEKKQVRKLVLYLKDDKDHLKTLALNALTDLVKSRTLPDDEQKAVTELLDPIMGISDQMQVDDLTDPYEIRKLAVNEFFNRGKFDSALYAMKKAVEMKPKDASFLNNLAAVYARKENFEEARKVWEEILSAKPDESTAVENYTTALQIRARKLFEDDKESPQGEELLLRIIQMNPTHVNTLNSLAELCFNRKEYEKAVDYFKECLKNSHFPSGNSSVNEYRGRVNRKLGDCYSYLGRNLDAAAYYNQALNIYQWDDTSKQLLTDTIARLEKGETPEEPA